MHALVFIFPPLKQQEAHSICSFLYAFKKVQKCYDITDPAICTKSKIKQNTTRASLKSIPSIFSC